MLRSSAMRRRSVLSPGQRYRAGQGTTVSAPSESVIKKGMTRFFGGHALLMKLLRSGRLP